MLNYIADLCILCSQSMDGKEKIDYRRQIAEWRHRLKLEVQKEFQLSDKDEVARDSYLTSSDLLDDFEARCHCCQRLSGEGASICLLIRDYLDLLADLGSLEDDCEPEIAVIAQPETKTAKVIPIGWAEFTKRYQER